ncbi:transposase [Orientia tsutsugamushi]|uniref:transposase n=1 Tax=Orientia tsutsugamushi TaxID=784 RepID=UPI0035291FDF
MKTYLLDIQDKRLLNKRSLIESVFNVLKKHMLLEHTRHRSPKEEKLTQIAVDNRSIQVRLLYFLVNHAIALKIIKNNSILYY